MFIKEVDSNRSKTDLKICLSRKLTAIDLRLDLKICLSSYGSATPLRAEDSPLIPSLRGQDVKQNKKVQ